MKRDIVLPLVRRTGSMIAGGLATLIAVDPGHLADIETGIVAALAVMADLFASWWNRRNG